jgi:hypothetical protein
MPKIQTISVGFSIPGLRHIMQTRPELKLERAFCRSDGNPITRDEAIAWLQQLEAKGITSSLQLEK